MSEFLRTGLARVPATVRSEKFGQKAERESSVNRLRRKNNLKPLVIETRRCLRCERKFTSQGGWHRMCDYCRDQQE